MPLGLVIFAFAWIALNVTAASSPFKISDATITNKTGGVDATINSFEDTKINSSATFYQVNGSITYAVTLQNTTDKNFKISAITDDNSNPYLAYSYASHAGEEVVAGGNLKLDVTVTYVNNIPDPEARIQNFDVKFLLDYEEIAEEPVEDDEEIVVPNTNDDTVVPDTGANTAEKSGASANPLFITAAIIGVVLIICGLYKTKLDIKTKAIMLAVLGTLATMTVTNAVSANFTFEIANEINLKDLLYVTSEVNGIETKSVVNYGGTLSLVTPQKAGYTFAGWQDENGNPFNPATPITDDAKIKAVFTVDNYTISYDLNGGTTATSNATSYTVNDSITLIEPTKEHYEFTGWAGTDLTELTKNIVIATGSTGNREYTANYTPVNYRITYDNITPEELVLMYNPTSYNIETASFTLRNPETRRDGDGDATEIFVGWNDGGTISNTVTLPNAGSMDNKNFVAVWEPVSSTVYTITYNLNGGTTATANRTEFTKETEAFTLVNPTKLGYQFKGWSGTGLTGDENLAVTVAQHTRQNLEFEAHYTPNTYNVIFDGNTGAGTMNSQTLTYDQATNLTANAFTKTGHHFVSWNTAADGSGSAYTDGEEVENLRTEGESTLFAQWEANTYEIILDGNHANLIGTMDNFPMVYGETKALPLNMFGVLGSAFDSWNTRADGSGDKYNNGSMVTNLAEQGTVTLYAQWAVTPYTVIYDKNSNEATGTMASQEIAYGVPENLLANGFARTGYTFMGWNTEANGTGDHYDDQQRVINLDIDGTVNLYAEWRANTYEIAFDKNAVEATGEMANLEMHYDTAANLTVNIYERAGYTFGGWNSQADGLGQDYTDGQQVNNLTTEANATVTLYAKWNPTQYTIVFHANSDNVDNPNVMSPQVVTYDVDTQLSPSAYTWWKHKLLGWTTNADGTGVEYEDKATVRNLNANSGEVHLYGKWRETDATFETGSFVKAKFTQLVEEEGHTLEDVTAVRRFNGTPAQANLTDDNIISVSDSVDPIYTWYDKDTTTIYWWTEDSVPTMNVNAKSMFSGFANATVIDVANINTGDTVNMSGMFTGDSKVEYLDLTGFDTSKVQDMSYMFKGVNVAKFSTASFDTENVTTFYETFSGVGDNPEMETLDLTNFSFAKVKTAYQMFIGSKSKYIKFANFDAPELTAATRMFGSSYNLISVDFGTSANLPILSNMQGMFEYCNKLEVVDFSKFSTPSLTNMANLFAGDSSLASITFGPNFDTSKVGSMGSLFSGLPVEELDLSMFDTTNTKNMANMFRSSGVKRITFGPNFKAQEVTNMSNMFFWSKIEELDLSTFTPTKVEDFSSMFEGAHQLTSLNLGSGFVTTSAKNMARMFCRTEVSSLDLSSFNTSNVVSMSGMFQEAKAETITFGANFVTTNVTDMSGMFSTSGVKVLDLTTFNTANVTDMTQMFRDAKSLTTIYATDAFTVENANMDETNPGTGHGGMFYWASQIVGGMGTKWSSDHMDKSYAHIDGGPSNPGYFTDKTKLNVFYYPNDNEATGTMEDQLGVVVGEGVKLNANQYEKTGYKFGGWNTETDGSGDHYDDEQIVTKNGFLKLYAQWGESPYTVIFDKNADDAQGSMESISKIYGEHFDLPASTFTRQSYIFQGWNTEADGSGEHYGDQENVINLDTDGEVTLYAEWLESTAILMNHSANSGINKYMKALVGNSGDTYSHGNNTIKHFKRSQVEPSDEIKNGKWNKVSASNSNLPIYIWFDEETGTISWWSEAETVYLPEHSEYMFSQLGALEDADIEEFDTSKAVNMAGMFWGNSSLQSIDLSNFDTDGVTDMRSMFAGCKSLSTLDITSFETKDVTDMSNMFAGVLVETLDVTGFNTANVTDFHSMFTDMKNLTTLDVSGFITNSATKMNAMFKNCEKLATIDVSGFNTAGVTSFEEMFRGCKSVTELDVSGFVTSAANSIGGMFYNCNTITSLNVTNFDTSNVTNLNHTFLGLTNVKKLDLSSFDTSNVTGMQYTFAYNPNLETIYVSDKFVTSSVGNSQLMFYQCGKLVGGLGTRFSGQFINHARAHIDGGPDNPGYFTDKNRIIITYHKNDDRATGEMPVQNQAAGTITLNTNQFFRGEGYSFGGWNTEPDGSGEHYDNGQTIVDAFGSLNLYAEWGITPYTIIFDKNGAGVTGTTASMSVNYGERVNLNQSGFAREHYVQTGWNTKADGTGRHFDDGESVINVINDGEITLYAEWVESIAKFDIGKNVNATIKRLSNAGSESSHPNRAVKHIVRASSMPNLDSNRIRTISSTDSNLPIYAWYDDSSDSTAYWYTLAEKVSLNEDSSDLFRGFYSLREFDYTQFEETAFTNVSYMFASCEKLESISLGNMDTSRVEDMSNMFFGTKSLEVIDLSMLNTANVKDMNNMFHDTGARVIDISSFDTSKVENMTEMFRGHEETGATQNLVTIYASDKFVTTNVTKSTFMFRRQSAIVGGAGTTWSGHGDSIQFAHIDGGVDNPGYFTDIADKP
ncbi:MAG: BspA family leucine-rich repeat surface protein [Candidatus Saccharibacteria bacterium]|nr:BspA family leucine-rich repeat surface protein [Candidatus Saccharibacteria bacterium]